MGKLYLCKPNRVILGSPTGLIEDSCSLTTHTADIWELSFDVYRYITDEYGNYVQSDYYESIAQNMELYLETEQTCTFFRIDSNPIRKNDGIQEITSVTAHSIECELQNKILNNFKANCGTIDSLEYLAAGINNYTQKIEEWVSLVNYENHELSLLHMAIEKSGATWSIANNLDTEICSKKLTFDINSQDIYSFLMNDVSNAARVIFDFDRKNKIISFKPVEELGEDTGIVISMKNLMKDFEISSTSSENIITKYTPKGANNLGVEYVNFGEDYILNLHYLMNATNEYGDYQYVSSELHDKYKNWINFRNNEKITYDGISGERTRREWYAYFTKQYNSALMSKNELTNRVPNDGCNIDYTTYKYEELEVSLRAYMNAVASLLTIYRNEYNIPDGTPTDENALKETVYWNDYYAYQYKIIPSVKEAMKLYCDTDASGNLKVDGNGNYIVLDGGNPAYNKGDNIVKSIDNWLYEWELYGLDELEAKRKAWIEVAVLLRKDEFFKSNGTLRTPDINGWNELTDTQKQAFTGYSAYVAELNSYLDYYAISARPNSLTGTITNKGILLLCDDAILERKAEIAEQESALKQIDVKRKDLAASVNLKNYSDNEGHKIFSSEDLQIIELLIKEAAFQNNNILTTNLDDIVTTVDAQELLYQDSMNQLYIESQPQYSFSCNIDNLFHLDEFKPFADNFKLNNYIYVNTDIYKELMQKVRVITITYNPLIVTEDIEIGFSTMTKSLEGMNDFKFLLNECYGSSGSSSSSSSGSGGTYGTNDAEIQIANTMLNALLSTETFGTSVSNVILDTMSANKGEFRRLFANSGAFYGLETGELKVSGDCLVDKIQSFNYEEGVSGSKLELSNGSFDFAGGKFKYDSDKNKLNIVVDSFSLSSGKTIDSIADSAINDFISSVYNPKIAELQAQIDGQIETWYFDYEPTLSNEPTKNWTTEIEREKHEGDLFYWKSKGFAYRFFKDNNIWKWQLVQDTDITKALAEASKAQDTADGKRRVFVTTPAPPYDVGDLWVQGVNGDIMRCQVARQSGSYIAADWVKASKYTDDSAVIALDTKLNNTQEIFNRLTQNGKLQGIFLKDESLYVNGEYVQTKGLKSINNDGITTFSIDNNGNVNLNVKSLKITGSDVATQTYVSTIAKEEAISAVSSQTQSDIFNKLTNNGNSQGVFIEDGQLYFSFSYGKGGELALGGLNNTDGQLNIMDENGNKIGSWNKDGFVCQSVGYETDIAAPYYFKNNAFSYPFFDEGIGRGDYVASYLITFDDNYSGEVYIRFKNPNYKYGFYTLKYNTDDIYKYNVKNGKLILTVSNWFGDDLYSYHIVNQLGYKLDTTPSIKYGDVDEIWSAGGGIKRIQVYTGGNASGNVSDLKYSYESNYMTSSGKGMKIDSIESVIMSDNFKLDNGGVELFFRPDNTLTSDDMRMRRLERSKVSFDSDGIRAYAIRYDENNQMHIYEYLNLDMSIVDGGLKFNDPYSEIPVESYFGTHGIRHTKAYEQLSFSGLSKRALYVGSDGTISAASSSRRYKQDISVELDEYFDPKGIYSLPVCQARYKKEYGGGDDSPLYLTFIAEDVAKYFPAAARWNKDHTEVDTWEMSDMFPAVVKLVQDQHKEIEELKSKVMKLEQKN